MKTDCWKEEGGRREEGRRRKEEGGRREGGKGLRASDSLGYRP
jgi:hypothetical protein